LRKGKGIITEVKEMSLIGKDTVFTKELAKGAKVILMESK